MRLKTERKEKRYQVTAWISFGLAACFYAYQFALRVSPSVMTESLLDAFMIDAGALGLLISFYYYGYAPFQVPAGILLDRYGPKYILQGSILLCILGVILFTFGPLPMAYAGRFLIGLGSAASFLICMKTASDFFPASILPALTSLSVLVGTFGAVGGSAPLAHSTHVIGWRHTMIILLLMAFVFFALALFVFRQPRRTTLSQKDKRSPSIKAALRRVFFRPITWITGGIGIFMYAPLAAFCDLWGVPFVEAVYGLSSANAAFAVILTYIGFGLFAPVTPFLLKKLGSYQKTFIFSALASAVLFSIIITAPIKNFTFLCVLMFSWGGLLIPQILAFSLLSEHSTPEISGLVNGFHNMLCMMSGIITQPLIGYLLETCSHGHSPIKSDYQFAMLPVLGSFMLACVCSFFVNKRFFSQTTA